MSGKVKTVMEKIIEDVAIIDRLKPDQVTQFSELALKFLQTGANKKMYKSAAKHIGASIEEVGRCIMGISKLLMNGIRRKLTTRISFSAFVEKVGVPENASEPMAAFFSQNRDAIQLCVAELGLQLPRYQNLDWRLDVEVSRRMAHNVFEPNFMFKLDTQDSELQSQFMQVRFENTKSYPCKTLCDELMNCVISNIDIRNAKKYIYMCQVDMKTVKFLRSQLKAALQESDSVHQKRINKYVR